MHEELDVLTGQDGQHKGEDSGVRWVLLVVVVLVLVGALVAGAYAVAQVLNKISEHVDDGNLDSAAVVERV